MKTWRRVLFHGVWLLFLFLLTAAVAYWCCDPPLDQSEVYPSGVILRDRSGKIIRVGLGEGDVDCRPFYHVSTNDWVVKALIAAEDGRFYSHCGVSLRSVLRAVRQNVTSMRRISGASTLTMQSVRLISPHPRNLFWKVLEAFQSIRLERVRSKEWILEQYLNRAPFASNLVGIEAASQGWFGKPPRELSLGEASLLAGMVQCPTRFRPDRALSASLRRRSYVLKRMVELGMVTPEQQALAESTPLELSRSVRPFFEPFFADWTVQLLGKKTGDFTTTLDSAIQRSAEEQVRRRAENLHCSVAAVVIEVATGALRAMICSGDYFTRHSGQVNTAVSPRPAGSTLKPFILALALDRGLVEPTERVADIPRMYNNFAPVNFHHTFKGIVSVREALILSLNIPFIDLVAKCGAGEVNDTLRNLGLKTLPLEAGEHGLGIAVGNVNVRLIDLANAYATLAREGRFCPLQVLEPAVVQEGTEVFSDAASWLVGDILSGPERSAASTGHIADVRMPRFAWKTGTSSAYRDAWTVAWNPEYVVAVWCGHKIGKFGDACIIGGKAATPVAWEIFRDILPPSRESWFDRPQSVRTRVVCKASGLLPCGDCPETEEGMTLSGRSSSRVCSLHRRDGDGNVVEVWPKDVESYLNMSRKQGRIPSHLKISRPANHSEFKWIPGLPGQAIAVHPVNVGEDEQVWWYVDSVPFGVTHGTEPFLYSQFQLGTRVISCATLSQSDSIIITITR